MELYSAEELVRVRRPIASLISKSEKALQKLSPETWQHKMLTDNLKALRMGATLLDGDGGTGSLSQADILLSLSTFASMITKTESTLYKFAPGTAQYTLQTNRLFALKMTEDLIRREQEGE